MRWTAGFHQQCPSVLTRPNSNQSFAIFRLYCVAVLNGCQHAFVLRLVQPKSDFDFVQI